MFSKLFVLFIGLLISSQSFGAFIPPLRCTLFNTTTPNTTRNTSYTVPQNVRKLYMAAWGGGGAGGAGNGGFNGCGGGGGEIRYLDGLPALAGTVLNVQIGKGGTHCGVNGCTGGTGVLSSIVTNVGSVTLLSANPGTGGGINTGGPAGGTGGTGGTGFAGGAGGGCLSQPNNGGNSAGVHLGFGAGGTASGAGEGGGGSYLAGGDSISNIPTTVPANGGGGGGGKDGGTNNIDGADGGVLICAQ